jgi:uncharacterized protein (TIGR02268 family)
MRNRVSCWGVLLVVLVASFARASERDSVERNLYVSEDPADTANRVYVAGRIATVLRFEQEVDPARTKLLGWEGWFAPLLVGSKKVVLEALRNIEPGDHFMLLVTLVDGTEIPLVVTSRKQPRDGRREADQQVNVFRSRDSADATQASLNEARKKERELLRKVEKYEQQDSVDHALAALLAKGAARQTTFREHQKWVLDDGDAEFEVRIFTGKGKAAVVFKVTNQDPEHSWKLQEARLYTAKSWAFRPFALRTDYEEVAPGTSGHIAIVADKSAFVGPKGAEQLLLELYRFDGYRQIFVLLDPELIRD